MEHSWKIEGDRLYHSEHSWVKVEQNIAEVGVTDYIQTYLGEVREATITEVGEEIDQGIEYLRLDSKDQDVTFICPVSGVVLDVNLGVIGDPTVINDHCYSAWIIRIELSDPDELDDLMSADDYAEFLKELGL